MTGSDGARRGAAAAALVTAFAESGALALRAARPGRADLVARVADGLLHPPDSDLVPLGSLVALVAAAALVGAAFGAIGARLRADVAGRLAWLSILVIPGLWVVLVAAYLLRRVPTLLGGPLALLPGRLFEVLGAMIVYGSGAMMFALPIAAAPAFLSVVLVEGWTRPRTLAASGAARPGLRRATMAALAVGTVALAAYAALRWAP